MKQQFPEYYPLEKSDLDRLWKDCIFVLDTNVLLNLYRMSPNTRDEWIGILKRYKSQLWIPYQVALEFQRNRPKVIASSEKLLNEVESQLSKFQNSVEDFLNKIWRVPPEPLSKWKEEHRKALARLRQGIVDHTAKISLSDEVDPIRKSIDDLFGQKVGEKSLLDESDCKRRIAAKIPPGFEDEDKPGNDKYGDIAIWFGLIEYAKEKERPVIFVTAEKKKDWWLSAGEKTVGPLPELMREFRDRTEQQFYMYDAARFVELAAERAAKAISRSAIVETKAIEEAHIKTMSELVRSSMGNTLSSIAASIPNSILEHAAREGGVYHNQFAAFLKEEEERRQQLLRSLAFSPWADMGSGKTLSELAGLTKNADKDMNSEPEDS